ncbi:MAG: ABC transporter substrate-binding protein [Chthoniobacterales bacterium]
MVKCGLPSGTECGISDAYLMKYLHLILVGLTVAMLGGCGEAAKPSIKIGLNTELTGEMPAVGASSKNAAELYVSQVNAEGGVQVGDKKLPITLDVGDNGAKAEQAAAVAQRLISQDNVVAMVGPDASACAIPASEIAQSLKCPMISPWSTNPKTTIDTTTGKPKPEVFRACFTDTFQAQVLAKFALNNLHAKRAAVLYDVASEAPNGQANLFKKTFEENGGTIADFETYTTGDRDFSAQLTKIRASNPDIIFLPAYYNDVALIAKQARQLGIKTAFLGSDAWSTPEIITLGGSDVDGSYFCNHYSTQIATPVAKKFVTDYRTKYGQDPDDVAALTYDSFGLLAQAIKDAGSLDRGAVRDALSKIQKYDGVTGVMQFNGVSGDPVKSAVILQIKDGKFVWVANAAP